MILRITPKTFCLYDIGGEKISLVHLLKDAEKKHMEWVDVFGFCRHKNRSGFARVVAQRLPENQAEKAKKEWPFLKSVGYVEQTRIRLVRDGEGNDITPNRETFQREGSVRQPSPHKGDEEKDDIQVVGIVSDMEMSAEDMGKCKREHWSVENRLHHVLDDTFREDRSPAKKSKNTLALIRKFAACG